MARETRNEGLIDQKAFVLSKKTMLQYEPGGMGTLVWEMDSVIANSWRADWKDVWVFLDSWRE